tara:strand:+ start:216 stop:512 length:297 start_codon:yes stop_codon:yes gene_type:complete
VPCAPGDKDELVGFRARLCVDLHVEDGVAAVAVRQLAAEVLEGGALLALVLDFDVLLVVRDPEDHVLSAKGGGASAHEKMAPALHARWREARSGEHTL